MKHDSPIPTNRRRSAARPGFTLVELLVVIAIIAILSAMAAWGVFAMIGGQQRRNTESTITVVNKTLQTHWKYVIDEANKDEVISLAVQQLAGPDPTGQRARVLWRKVRLMEAFPQTFAEIGQPTAPPFVYSSGLIPANTPGIQQRYIADYQKKIPVPPPWFSATMPAANTNVNNASAACLLIALSANRGGSSLSQDQIKFAIKDTDGDNIPEIVDGWGHPLMFTRFDFGVPAQAANPAGVGSPTAKFSDPTDPEGMLLNAGWYNSLPPFAAPMTAGAYFDFNFHHIQPTLPTQAWAAGQNYTSGSSVVFGGKNYRCILPNLATAANHPTNAAFWTPSGAYYVIPSVMSAGADGKMPTPDDIYSFQLRGN